MRVRLLPRHVCAPSFAGACPGAGGECAAARHSCETDRQDDRRDRRFHRPVRGGRFGRGAGARLGLPRQGPVHGREHRQERRSLVRHRPAPLQGDPRPERGNARLGAGALRFRRGRPRARRATAPTGNIADQLLDQRRQNYLTSKSDLDRAQAALREARLNSNSPRSRRPIGGRIGRKLISVGNLINAKRLASHHHRLARSDLLLFRRSTSAPTSPIRALRAAGAGPRARRRQ